MLIKVILFITALWNICIAVDIFGLNSSEKNGGHMKDTKVSVHHTQASISGPRIYFDTHGNNSRDNSHRDQHSNNIILNSFRPFLRSYTTAESNRRNATAFNFSTWKILNANTEGPLQQKLNIPRLRKCIRDESTDKRRPGCLRKVNRRKVLSEENNANAMMIYNSTFDTKDTHGTSNKSPATGTNFHQSVEDKMSTTVNRPHDDNDKMSTNSGTNPCSCNWRQESCGCTCKGTLNYDDFQDVARTFFPCHNFTFKMSGGEYYALPPNFFSRIKNVQDFNLFITNSTFEYMCDPTPLTSPFKGILFDSSAQIKLTNVNVRRGWNWKPFEQLKSSSGAQVNVTLENCQLRRLSSDFANLAEGHVDTVDIFNSDLQMVGSNAFRTFENMTRFRIPSNKIRQLRRTDFSDLLFNLEELDLRNNELSYLDNDLFTNMPSLKEILLSGNPISVLPEITFQAVISKTELVGISDIPLTCDCRLQWLKDSVKHNNRTEKNMKGAICRRPPYLRGMPFDFLSKEHLLCT